MPVNRTLYQVQCDLAYAVRYNELNERLYRRVQWFTTFVGAVAATGAVTSFLKQNAELGVMVSGFVAVLSIFSITVRPGERAQEFKQICKRLRRLEAKIPELSKTEASEAIAKLDSEWIEIISDAPPGLESLGVPAQNDVFHSSGFPELCDPLNFVQRLLKAIA